MQVIYMHHIEGGTFQSSGQAHWMMKSFLYIFVVCKSEEHHSDLFSFLLHNRRDSKAYGHTIHVL